MITISLCMIVKDEERVLERCLESVKDIVDEIIIVDTGSVDKTKEIAQKYTKKVYDFKWNDDFSSARNYSFSKATKDFCMWLDADDVILENQRQRFIEYKKELNNNADTIMMKYNIAFDERGNPTFSYYRERIVKRCERSKWQGEIHEVITPFGNILYTDISVTHKKINKGDSLRNLNIYEKMLSSGKELEPRHQFYYAKELYYNKKHDRAIKELEKFLDNENGWIENKIDACEHLAYSYREINNLSKEISALFKSFEYDVPRAEICCDIGNYFFKLNKYNQAIFWYEAALKIEKSKNTLGFIKNDCYDYIPYMQLCVCHYRLGNINKSIEYNQMAKEIKPYDKAVDYNIKVFKNIRENIIK